MLEISKGICNFILIVSIEGKRGQLLISGKIVGSLAISSDYIGSPMIKTLVERVQEICHSIGFQKTQIYQRFAGSRQEVFILKIQNSENNAAQQDNGRRFL